MTLLTLKGANEAHRKHSFPHLLLQRSLSRNVVWAKLLRDRLRKESWEKNSTQEEEHENMHAFRELQNFNIIWALFD